ncbi:mitochondrial carrier [Ramicandelaber brevisporus]|nr:mitochondrial carrier [Ramicandelaber brevisporus]
MRPPRAPFWFGGASAMFATVLTHPMDLTKVRLQTRNTATAGIHRGAVATLIHVGRHEGIAAMFSGLSASLLRQATYTTTRFAVYDIIRDVMIRHQQQNQASGDKKIEFPAWKIAICGCIAGAAGAVVGNPADIVNIRMQNDGQLPLEQRRNYRHALDGLITMAKNEGWRSLYVGLGTNTQRAILMTLSQLGSYDFIKQRLVAYTSLKTDSVITHISASLLAGLIATTVCSPVDVIKTRVMNAPPGRYSSPTAALIETVRTEGLRALFKGWLPSYARLGPHTLITFMVLEQLNAVHTDLWRKRQQATLHPYHET